MQYESGIKYTNRYRTSFYFIRISDKRYELKGDLKYWRCGGKEGQEGIDYSDLGFIDPSGGPFLFPGFVINGEQVKRIFAVNNTFGFEV